jgi:hypothetical protein
MSRFQSPEAVREMELRNLRRLNRYMKTINSELELIDQTMSCLDAGSEEGDGWQDIFASAETARLYLQFLMDCAKAVHSEITMP